MEMVYIVIMTKINYSSKPVYVKLWSCFLSYFCELWDFELEKSSNSAIKHNAVSSIKVMNVYSTSLVAEGVVFPQSNPLTSRKTIPRILSTRVGTALEVEPDI